MGKITGFMEYQRQGQPYRSVEARIKDWQQVMSALPAQDLKEQAARCMDCGIPFCHQGCPLGNLIPDWNDLVYKGKWREAIDRLHATNNFPEFTGALCPAPCEGACVLGINSDAVTIKAVELAIIDYAFEQGWVKPVLAVEKTGKRVAVVGSGPAGLAAAQQLARIGHEVTVFERDDRIGGLLRYGIPEFKMEKSVLDRRLAQMGEEGVIFQTGIEIGSTMKFAEVMKKFEAVLLACGATAARELQIEGKELKGIYQAMDYLPMQNRLCEGDTAADFVSAEGLNVVIIGGGDTGSDCLGTANRQGASKVYQLEIMPRPPQGRLDNNPWPEWPRVFRVSSSHEEGGERLYSVSTRRFLGDDKGHVRAIELVDIEVSNESGSPHFNELPGSERELPCNLVLLALGFLGPEKQSLLETQALSLDSRGNVIANQETWMTSQNGVFVAGDMRRGQSLIVWAIAEGRSAARAIDEYLMGHSSMLPAPVTPSD